MIKRNKIAGEFIPQSVTLVFVYKPTVRIVFPSTGLEVQNVIGLNCLLRKH